MIKYNDIEVIINRSSFLEFEGFINGNLHQFKKELSNRIKQGYTEKLFKLSTRFEAWQGDKLVGIVCVYLNTATGVAYIPYVCVIKGMQRMGVCKQLLDNIQNRAVSMGLKSIELEVYRDNQPAINAYTRLGMSQVEDLSTQEKLYMRKSL